MKLWRWDLIIIFALLFVACPLDDCDSAAGPSPTTTTTTIQELEPTKPPRVDVRPDLYGIRGCTAFGAAALTESGLLAFIHHVKAEGCDIIRVGAQTDGWANTSALYLQASVGPPVLSAAWKENLKRLLDVTSRIDGISLQLIPTFTHKHEGFQRCMEITREVVAIQQAGSEDDPTPYRHIVWEAMNEYKHPLSRVSRDQVAKLLGYLKSETGLPVGTDSSGGHGAKWIGEYRPELLPLVDYVAFHPPRNDMHDGKCTSIRPDYWQLLKTIHSYGKPVWIDEPTCYISDDSKDLYGISWSGHYALCGGGTEAARQKFIKDYMWDVEHAGGVWFTHATWLFECRRLGWLPN